MADAQIDKLSKELYKNQSSLNPALFGDDEDDLFRPTLADNVKVGYFNLDRACQTHESDVIPLKEMTVVLQDLTKDAVTIKRDIHLTRKKLETDYETRLQDKTFALYSRINEKLKELEATHVERVGIVRKAYRQQLADALARVETLFQSRFEKQMERDREKHKVELSKLQGQVSNLTQTIQRNESVIIMLKKQLASKQKVEEELQALRSKVRTRIPLPSLDIGIQCLLGTVVHEDEPPEGAVISQQNEQSQEVQRRN